MPESEKETSQLIPFKTIELHFLLPEITDNKALISVERDLPPAKNLLWVKFSEGKPVFGFWVKSGSVDRFTEAENLEQSRGKFSGLVINASNGENIQETLNGLVSRLPANTPVRILEKTSAQFDLDAEESGMRLSILEGSGLVGLSIKRSSEANFGLWQGRTAKERKTPEGVDLTERWWFQEALRQLKQEARLRGYKSIDPKVLLTAAGNSTNVWADRNRVHDGLGVVYEAYCGCRTEHAFNGDQERIYRCSDEDCDGSPREEDILKNRQDYAKEKGIYLDENGMFVFGRNMPFSSVYNRPGSCGDCYEEFLVNRVRTGKSKGRDEEVKSERLCSKHGTIESGTVWIDKMLFTPYKAEKDGLSS